MDESFWETRKEEEKEGKGKRGGRGKKQDDENVVWYILGIFPDSQNELET